MAVGFKYWRLKFLASAVSSFNPETSLSEFTVRATPGGANLPLTDAQGVAYQSYVAANAIDGNPATVFLSAGTNAGKPDELTVHLASGTDLQEFTIRASSTDWQSYRPLIFSLQGGWVRGTWLKIADYDLTSAPLTNGETRAFAIPSYAHIQPNMMFVDRAQASIAIDSGADAAVTVGKSIGYGVADFATFSAAKTMSYGVIDIEKNGVAKAMVYAIVEEAPFPGKVDGFRMRNSVARNVVMRGGKPPQADLPQ